MGKRGPQPKPKEERLLEGNPAKRAIKAETDEDDLSSGSLRMPTRLTEGERAVWRETLEAFPSWYFRPADKALLIAYCRLVIRIEKSEKALQNKSAVQNRANGSPCINPHIAVINTALSQMMQLSEVLGLTRSKRKGVVVPQGNIPSPTPDQEQQIPPQNTQGGGGQDIPDDLIAPPI